ncbi:MAG: 16S rRNA (cytosine(967)-C(5))-methyltransferase RsmB [Actinomycetota bacterium]|nr:16S rRNA (cytosine(967)-C(5))-methyltransferase RsmB [Actinomycetota bacterium]
MATVTPARRAAYAVVRRVFEHGAYADRALHAEARALDPRERAFAMALAYGTVQRRLTLDHLIEQLARPVGELDAQTLAALRLGLYQLVFLDAGRDHAVVGESVELAKDGGYGGGHKLVNAVLRRAARERPALPADDTPAGAAVAHSYPPWLVELWWEAYGAIQTRALLRAGNEHGELALRANTLVTTREQLAQALPVPTRPADELPEALIVDGAFDAHGHDLWRQGAYATQSRGSMLVARALDPQPRERVLDLCAAPGGKTTHVAALMGDEGSIVAVERHAGRAAALRRTCERMRAGSVEVHVGDAASYATTEPFDRVLVDPPCSGLGTLQGHPDLRWRVSPESIEALAATQGEILRTATRALRPGGTLVYSTCTLSRRENEDQVGESGLRLQSERVLLPDRDRTDGFYIARLTS